MHETIGQRVLRLRTEQHMTLRDLAVPGTVSAPMISRIELGQRTPSVTVMRALAAKLGVSVDVIESGEENPVVVAGDALADCAAQVIAAVVNGNGQVDVAVAALNDELGNYDQARGLPYRNFYERTT